MLTVFSARQVHEALDWPVLSTALTAAFAVGAVVPLRHAHSLNADDMLLLMPAWNGEAIGVKLVTVIPGAKLHGAPTVGATYLLMDRASGTPLALLDGDALTVRRTAAVSAIAARHMAREDSRVLLMVGTGHLAPWMIRAHCALRPSLEEVWIWGRHSEHAESLADTLVAEGLPARAAAVLPDAVRRADIVSCATTARAPIVLGEWVRAGTHLDLVGGFTRDMREVDDAAIAGARIVVDSYDGALAEAGDLTDPIERGVLTRDAVVADLAALVRGEMDARTQGSDITVFKSVGTALADLAAAQAVMRTRR
jgi:alanine dehydrogenase